MLKKTYFVENRQTWKDEYGNFKDYIENIKSLFNFVNQNCFPIYGKGRIKVIDYGCAYGYYLKFLKNIHPEAKFYGVEIAEEAVQETQKIIGKSNVFWQSCGRRLPLNSNSIDFIYALEIIEHVADNGELKKFFLECNRLLKENGRMVITTPNGNWLPKLIFTLKGQGYIYNTKDHPNIFNLKKLKKIINPYLVIEKYYYNINDSLSDSLLYRLKYRMKILLRFSPTIILNLKKKNNV